jgi:hypothetical protein
MDVFAALQNELKTLLYDYLSVNDATVDLTAPFLNSLDDGSKEKKKRKDKTAKVNLTVF